MFARGNGDAHRTQYAGDRKRPTGDHDHGALYHRRLPVYCARRPSSLRDGAVAKRLYPRICRRAAASVDEQCIHLRAEWDADDRRGHAGKGTGSMTRDIAFPYSSAFDGRTATAELEAHIYQMIEQLLFTSPGERVNRPTFGSGVMQLIFAPNSQELASATEHMIQSAIQQYLGDLIRPEAVTVTSEDATLTILVQYVIQRTQQRQIAQFEREV